MRLGFASIVLAAALAVTACVSSGLSSAAASANAKLQAQGLPFRWSVENTDGGEAMVMHMLPLPAGPSKADAHMTTELLNSIRANEQRKGRTFTKLQEVRQMPDGREVWILQSLGSGVGYVVNFQNTAQGLTKVLGPYSFAK